MDLIVFTGLQGSGKSSFYRERFAATHAHVSKDHFPNARNPGARQERLIREAMAEGLSVVVDNTNPSVEVRAPLIALGRELGAQIIGYVFETDPKVCYEQNARRVGKARVPDVGFFATLKKLQPPTYAEGFDLLYRVCLADDQFELKQVLR